jgi:hypothetical protein
MTVAFAVTMAATLTIYFGVVFRLMIVSVFVTPIAVLWEFQHVVVVY